MTSSRSDVATSLNETTATDMLVQDRKSSSAALLAGFVIAVAALGTMCAVVAAIYAYVYWTKFHRGVRRRPPSAEGRRPTIGAGVHDQPVAHVTCSNERCTHVFMFHR